MKMAKVSEALNQKSTEVLGQCLCGESGRNMMGMQEVTLTQHSGLEGTNKDINPGLLPVMAG